MEAERELLLFVLAAVRTPEKVTRAEVERLRGLGWTSRNIFDAVYHGAQMVALSLRLKAFVK
jgi:alkylhydroperoxidase family enzyme